MKKINQKSKTKSQISKLFYLVVFLIFNLVFASIVIASSGGAEGEHAPWWKDYIWKIINFGILVFILVKFGKKPLQSFLKQRTELIQKTLNEAREAKELAQKALQEVEGRLKTKDKEVEEILAASKRSGELERDALVQESDKLRAKILEQARTNIEFELKNAKEVIKAEAVEIAMELAEKKLKEKLTKEDQERLLEESLVKIGGRG